MNITYGAITEFCCSRWDLPAKKFGLPLADYILSFSLPQAYSSPTLCSNFFNFDKTAGTNGNDLAIDIPSANLQIIPSLSGKVIVDAVGINAEDA